MSTMTPGWGGQQYQPQQQPVYPQPTQQASAEKRPLATWVWIMIGLVIIALLTTVAGVIDVHANDDSVPPPPASSSTPPTPSSTPQSTTPPPSPTAPTSTTSSGTGSEGQEGTACDKAGSTPGQPCTQIDGTVIPGGITITADGSVVVDAGVLLDTYKGTVPGRDHVWFDGKTIITNGFWVGATESTTTQGTFVVGISRVDSNDPFGIVCNDVSTDHMVSVPFRAPVSVKGTVIGGTTFGVLMNECSFETR